MSDSSITAFNQWIFIITEPGGVTPPGSQPIQTEAGIDILTEAGIEILTES